MALPAPFPYHNINISANIYGAVVMATTIVRVHPVHVMNVASVTFKGGTAKLLFAMAFLKYVMSELSTLSSC